MKHVRIALSAIAGITAATVPLHPAYAVLRVSTLYAGGITWPQIFNSIITTMAYTIFVVSATAFLIGALMYTAGFISEENKSKGKNLMIGALFGMGIVLCARAIFNTAYFFVYDS